MLLERNPVVIGIIAAVVIAAGTGFALLMTRGIFDRGHEVTAIFADAAGLSVDDQVLAAGLRVGRVTGVELNGDRVEVSFIVSGDLPSDTRARIAVQNLLGRRQLHLMAGSNWDNLLRTGDVIPLRQTSTPVDVPEFGETGEHLYREQDQEALQAVVTSLADIVEDKQDEVGDLIDGLTRVADTVAEQREDLHLTIEGAERFFAAFRDRDEEIVRIVDSFGTTLELLVERRPDLERLLRNTGDSATLLADLVIQERQTLDTMLTQLHRDLRVVDRTMVDIAHFFAYAPVAVEGWSKVGYDEDGNDTPHWFNMHVDQAGALSFDMILGCGGLLDEAIDSLFGFEDPRDCREQDAEPPPTEGNSGSFQGFFRLHSTHSDLVAFLREGEQP
jgi:phospholipid/cholesterol/gamma-HCH transport system substrate-binding protein